MSAALSGQTLNTLYSFGHNELGYQPASGVVIGPSVELYGTTSRGGAAGVGIAYELAPPASQGGAWTETVLHTFSGQGGNGSPSPLFIGPSGVLYGVTSYGDGTVFQLKPPAGAGAHWLETTIYAFTEPNGFNANPKAPPIFGPHSVLYGTTAAGGTNTSGSAYRLAPPSVPGGAWAQDTIYNFTADDGEEPGLLTLSGDGTIYGAALYGGLAAGTIFRLVPPAAPGGSWTEATLYEFGAQPGDSGLPNGVVLGQNGVLYGTAMGDTNGRKCGNGCGTVFQISPPSAPGGTWTETILHTFTGGSGTADGSQPNSTPVLGPNGVLYGTTLGGGIPGRGTIYEMLPPASPGGIWTEVILYAFSGADGWEPNAVILGPDGNLYGTTRFGGVSKDGVTNQGTVFQLVLP